MTLQKSHERSISPPPVAVPGRDRLVIFACLALVTVLAWAYLVHLARQMSTSVEHETMMAAMGMTMDMPWSAADFFFTFAMWAVMMAGMMSGTAAPVLLLFAGARAARGARRASIPVLMFGLGYLIVWIVFSAGAASVQWILHQMAMLSPEMAASSRYLAAAILLGAGAYQLTPFKGACLAHCRSPLGFLMTNWRDGTLGALQMGMRHGTFCLGCCWALMCVLFAVGVMNLFWVAVLTVLVLLEKVGPRGVVVGRLAGVAMIVFGIAIAVR